MFSLRYELNLEYVIILYIMGNFSVLFQFAMSQDPNLLVQCMVNNTRLVLAICNEGTGNAFLQCRDMHYM